MGPRYFPDVALFLAKSPCILFLYPSIPFIVSLSIWLTRSLVSAPNRGVSLSNDSTRFSDPFARSALLYLHVPLVYQIRSSPLRNYSSLVIPSPSYSLSFNHVLFLPSFPAFDYYSIKTNYKATSFFDSAPFSLLIYRL